MIFHRIHLQEYPLIIAVVQGFANEGKTPDTNPLSQFEITELAALISWYLGSKGAS